MNVSPHRKFNRKVPARRAKYRAVTVTFSSVRCQTEATGAQLVPRRTWTRGPVDPWSRGPEDPWTRGPEVTAEPELAAGR